jgi:hypothetical protein
MLHDRRSATGLSLIQAAFFPPAIILQKISIVTIEGNSIVFNTLRTLCTFFRSLPFVFNVFQTLWAKTPGVGYPFKL